MSNDPNQIVSDELAKIVLENFIKDFSLLQYSVIKNNKLLLDALILRGDDVNAVDCRGYTALHDAARKGNLAFCNTLIAAGADVNRPTTDNQTPLGTAIIYGKLKVVKALIDAGADLAQGFLLHKAVGYGQTGIVKLLIDKGLSANAVDDKGQTPLHHTCFRNWNRPSIFEMLLDNGAVVNALDNDNETPLDKAKKANPYSNTVHCAVKVLTDRGGV